MFVNDDGSRGVSAVEMEWRVRVAPASFMAWTILGRRARGTST